MGGDRTNTTLRKLELGANRIGDAGAVALAGALHVRPCRVSPLVLVGRAYMPGPFTVVPTRVGFVSRSTPP